MPSVEIERTDNIHSILELNEYCLIEILKMGMVFCKYIKNNCKIDCYVFGKSKAEHHFIFKTLSNKIISSFQTFDFAS